jgi:uncharacterized RDD family membrane protein YckC
MSEINIVTAQNVTLKIELANIGDRFLAAILDFLVKFGLVILIGLISATLKVPSFLTGCAVILIFTCYFLIFELAMKGQSPGKRMMKIRVARLDGGPLTFGNILLRWLFRIIDFPLSYIPTAGICAIVISEKHQRLGDMVAGTIVVSTKERVSLNQGFMAEIAPGYIPSYPQAEKLTSKEIEVIQEAFYQYRERDKYDLITLAAAKVKDFLQVHSNLDDVTFLKTVLTDHNFASINQGKTYDSKESFSYQL